MKNMMVNALVAVTSKITGMSLSTTCFWFFHQPEVPEELLEE